MGKITRFKRKPTVLASAAVGGSKEAEGGLGKYFDLFDRSDKFG